ncbi:MAG: hypothetical protein KatS3mg057_0008 [Herpetosiphonaceae bacterium]|nr:MAG: hypothetical protein KatS3mg057_0008 [Herpetosiphonaceae bacterium]
MQGQLALELAREHQPDLILLDLHLPDLSGEAILRLLQAQPQTREIPVVVLSADAAPLQMERMRDLGARAYISKPFEIRRLINLLEILIQHNGQSKGAALSDSQ